MKSEKAYKQNVVIRTEMQVESLALKIIRAFAC